MTDSHAIPHSTGMLEDHATGLLGVAAVSLAAPQAEIPAFRDVYETFFPYVWRSVQRLGVGPSQVDDVVQEVFVVVHRKLGSFEGRSSLKTWLYGITLRVARVHRLRFRASREVALESVPSATDPNRPDEAAMTAEAARVVGALLDKMDDDQREVFILAEFEQLSAPEIAEALGVKLNTVYSRLRLARAAFADGAARYRARDAWRGR